MQHYSSLFVLLLLTACQHSTDDIHQPPVDLTIVNPIWTRSDPHHQYDEVEVSEHDFTIKNSSDSFAYNRIIVSFRYFDQHQRLLHKGETIIRRRLKPHESYRVKGLGVGVVKPGTQSATVELVEATRERQLVIK